MACRLTSIFIEPGSCEHCNQRGYRGRRGIYELIEIDQTLARLVNENAAEHVIREYSQSKYPALGEHGRETVLAGETSLEEVLRVTATGLRMAAYSYRALNHKSDLVKGIIEGDSKRQVRAALRAQSLKPLAS